MGTGEFTASGKPRDGLASHPGGVETLLVASCYGNWDKLRPDGPLGSYADFTTCINLVGKRLKIFTDNNNAVPDLGQVLVGYQGLRPRNHANNLACLMSENAGKLDGFWSLHQLNSRENSLHSRENLILS